MDTIRENAKAIAAALSTLLVLILRPLMPQVADPTFQPALEVVLSFAIVGLAVWLVPNRPKGDAAPPSPTGLDDRKPAPPITGLLFAAALLPVLLGACTTVSPRQQFVNGCATVGEAMAQVVALRRAGKVDDATYVAIDDAYDAAVETCSSLPPTDDAASVAMLKIEEFLTHAGGVTGVNYGSY